MVYLVVQRHWVPGYDLRFTRLSIHGTCRTFRGEKVGSRSGFLGSRRKITSRLDLRAVCRQFQGNGTGAPHKHHISSYMIVRSTSRTFR